MSEQRIRPQAIPRCAHGYIRGIACKKCRDEDNKIANAVKPLADEFWEHRGKRDIEHLLQRAYRMGAKHSMKIIQEKGDGHV